MQHPAPSLIDALTPPTHTHTYTLTPAQGGKGPGLGRERPAFSSEGAWNPSAEAQLQTPESGILTPSPTSPRGLSPAWLLSQPHPPASGHYFGKELISYRFLLAEGIGFRAAVQSASAAGIRGGDSFPGPAPNPVPVCSTSPTLCRGAEGSLLTEAKDRVSLFQG